MNTKPPTTTSRLRSAVISVAAGGSLLVAPATALATEGESARGTIKIEEHEFNDPDNPNEVKAGCDFRVDFFGFDEQTVPITFTLAEPSGDDSEVGEVVAEREAQLEEARGNESSGSLDVDITDDLSNYQPAQAEDFDYKLRADVVVKESEGSEVTKTANLFIDCPDAVMAATAANTTDDSDADADADSDADAEVANADDAAADTEEADAPQGGVDTGGDPAGSSPAPVTLALLAAGLLATGTWVARRAVTARQ